MFFGFSSFDWLVIIAGFAITGLAQLKVRNAYNRYSQIVSRRGVTGAAIAKSLLRGSGIDDVEVEHIPGELTDHYDPRDRVLRLSDGIYNNPSIAAVGIAAHEVGHAIQHNVGYAALGFRNTLVPVANIGSQLAWPLVFAAMIFSSPLLLDLGIMLFGAAVLFTLVTLPVEFNASRRAMVLLRSGGYLQGEELEGAQKVLSAAALTYVAAAAVAVLNLIRLLMMRRDD